MVVLAIAMLVSLGVLVLVFFAGVRFGSVLTERNIAVAELKEVRKKAGLD